MNLEPIDVIAKAITEKELQDDVINLMHALGYLVVHFRPARTNRTYRGKDGKKRQVWVTPVQGDGRDYPDLTFFHPVKGRHGWVELKRKGAKPTPGQIAYGELIKASGGEYYLWYPIDWINGTVERVLKGEF